MFCCIHLAVAAQVGRRSAATGGSSWECRFSRNYSFQQAAFVFLTRLPLGGHPYSAADRAWSAAHFPLVGLVIGALTALTLRLLWGVGPLAAALLTIGVQLLITGAFHEDGLADSADALGGGTTRARTLEILKDSRVGTYGAAALVISIAGRAALLATIAMRGRAGALWALPLVACAARTFPIWLMRLLPYATPPEVARNKDVAGTGATQAWVATAWLLLALLVIVPLAPSPITAGRAFAVLAVLAALTVLAGARFRARVGGVTGDFLGAMMLFTHAVIWGVALARGSATVTETATWGPRFWFFMLPIMAAWCGVAQLVASQFRVPVLALLVTFATFFVLFIVYAVGELSTALRWLIYVDPNAYDAWLLSPHVEKVALGTLVCLGISVATGAAAAASFSRRDL